MADETQKQIDHEATEGLRQQFNDHRADVAAAVKANQPTPLILFLQKLRTHNLLSDGQAPEEMFLTLLWEYEAARCASGKPLCDGSGSERYNDFTDRGFAGEGDRYGISEYTDQSFSPDAPQNKVGPDGKTDAERGCAWGNEEHLAQVEGKPSAADLDAAAADEAAREATQGQ